MNLIFMNWKKHRQIIIIVMYAYQEMNVLMMQKKVCMCLEF